ncbi:hypothetical protein C9374_007458 [Naegleria lovaniensis]|uniref:CKK domain-containing protein n=1 Tax=Naegleria lovaniensis TaxID=51637 RepID=A0AA88KLV1_NAELO|nr:uncharacterized protein C9374_007458 [Naegleria lovaniensis]KAG2379319.1 hypothetical protein C9374_007458 [Naegleria lovaniensis]
MSVRTYSLIHQNHQTQNVIEEYSEEEEEEGGYKDLSSGGEEDLEESPEDLLASVTTVIKIPENRSGTAPASGGYAALFQQQKKSSGFSSSSTKATNIYATTKNDLPLLQDSLVSLAAITKTNLPSYPQRYELHEDGSEEELDENDDENLQEEDVDDLAEEEEEVEEQDDDEYNDEDEMEEEGRVIDILANTISTVITNIAGDEEQNNEEETALDELAEVEDTTIEDSEIDEAVIPSPKFIVDTSYCVKNERNQIHGATVETMQLIPTENSVALEVSASSVPENTLTCSIKIEKSEIDDGYTDLEAECNDNKVQQEDPVVTSPTLDRSSVKSPHMSNSTSEPSNLTPIVDEKLLMKSISLFKQYNAGKVSQSTNGHPFKPNISSIKTDEPLRVSKILEIPKPLINLEESISDNDMDKIKKQNHLLRMQLLQQERIIEESKKVLQNRIEQEIEKAKSQALKDFISTTKKKPEPCLVIPKKHVASEEPKPESCSFKSVERVTVKVKELTPREQPTVVKKEVIEIPIDEFENSQDFRKKNEIRNKKFQELRKQKMERIEENKQKRDKTPVVEPKLQENALLKNMKQQNKTNKLLIKNALLHLCLAGEVNKKEREEVFEAMKEYEDTHQLLLLVREVNVPAFRALYAIITNDNSNVGSSTCTTDSHRTESSSRSDSSNSGSDSKGSILVKKVIGKGPKFLTEDQVEVLCRYDSGGKKLSKLASKSFSVTTDVVVLKASANKKTKK